MTVPLRFDQLDPTRQQAIQANVATMRAAGAPDSDIETYLSQHEHLAPVSAPSAPVHDFHAEYRSGQLARRMAAENSQDQAEAGGGLGTQVLGTLASLVRDIPGAEVLQSGASALLNHTSYSDARRQIRNAEDASVLETPARLVGGGIAAAALPSSMSPAMQGAAYGAASGALQSNPNAGLGDRATDAVVGAGVGAASGKIAESLTNAARSLFADRLSNQQSVLNAVRDQTDARNYGMAALEGQLNGGTSPAVKAALSAPDIQPYADIVRSSRTMNGADDATVLREAYKLMTERQQTLGTRILNTDNFKAGSTLEQQDINAAKGVLRNAATAQPDPLMPSFPQAVEQHAALKAVETANKQGSSITRAAMSGRQPIEKSLLNIGKDPDEFLRSAVPNMTPDEASAALSGVLGRTKDYLGANANPFKGFGLLSSLANASKVSPFVRALDQQSGGAPLGVSLLRSLLTSQGHPNP